MLRRVDWGTVTGNNIIDSGVRSRDRAPMVGVLLEEGTQGVQVVGNAIFNWGDQVPMKHGIFEGEGCSHNLLEGNNINYTTESGVVSGGENTIVGNNVSVEQPSYRNTDRVAPDFTTDRLQAFMRQRG